MLSAVRSVMVNVAPLTSMTRSPRNIEESLRRNVARTGWLVVVSTSAPCSTCPPYPELTLLDSHLLLGQPCKQRRIDAPLALLRGSLRPGGCGKRIEAFTVSHVITSESGAAYPSRLSSALSAAISPPFMPLVIVRYGGVLRYSASWGCPSTAMNAEPDSMLLPDAHCLNSVTTPPTGAATEPDSLRSTVTVTERSSSYGSDRTASVPARVADSNAAGSGSRVSEPAAPPATPA